MKTFLKTSTAVLFTIILAGCSDTANQPAVPMNDDDHHEGEEAVMPHGHEDKMEDMMNEPMEDMMNEHHEGEENVAPHDDEPVLAKPPSRSNLVDDHDDTGEEPHGH